MTTQKITLSITIKASKEKIWEVLLQDKTYRIWTSVFHADSCFEGSWETGTTMYFKTPEEDGMVSKVLEHKPSEIIILNHIGILTKGREDFESQMAKEWKGLETYKVAQVQGGVQLTVVQDIAEKHASWFQVAWEKALQKVKELAESPA